MLQRDRQFRTQIHQLTDACVQLAMPVYTTFEDYAELIIQYETSAQIPV